MPVKPFYTASIVLTVWSLFLILILVLILILILTLILTLVTFTFTFDLPVSSSFMSGLSGAARRYIDRNNPLTTALAQTFGGFQGYRKPILGIKGVARKEPIGQYGHGPRTDIVSERLCDDVLEYLAPTLTPYKGCTIIDINPGACVWTRKLHDFLKPKNHVLMEPETLYVESFIKPLLDQPGSTYKHSTMSATAHGLREVNCRSLLNDTGLLPEVARLDADDPEIRQTRPSLLITGNLARDPGRSLVSKNNSSACGVIQTHVWTSLSNEIFHRGGLARMLWWVPDHDKAVMLPQRTLYVTGHSVSLNLGAQLSEVTGGKPGTAYLRRNTLRKDDATSNGRSNGIDVESARQVCARMKRARMQLPKGRTLLQPQDLEPESPREMKSPMIMYYKTPKTLARAIDALEVRSQDVLAAVAQSKTVNMPYKLFLILDSFMKKIEYPQALWQSHDEREVNRGRPYRHRSAELGSKYEMADGALFGTEMRAALILDLLLCVVNLEAHYCLMIEKGKNVAALKDRIIELGDAICTKYVRDCPNLQQPIELMLDDNLTFYSSPQVLAHDKRPYEAFQASMGEFWPKADMSLLDVVPHPRDLTVPDIATKLDATQAGQDLVKWIYTFKAATLPWSLDRLAPNAARDLIPMVPAITDPRKGGRLNPDNVRVRVLSDEMLEGLIKVWFEWPFRPQRHELALAVGGGKASETSEYEEETEAVTDA